MGTTVSMPRSKRWGAGVYPVTIIRVMQTLDATGSIKKNKNSNTGFDVTFQSEDSREFTNTFWEGKATQWFIDAMLKVIGLDNIDGPLPVVQSIGEKLWIFIADEYFTHDGVILEGDDGLAIVRDKLMRKFAIYEEGGYKPVVIGDPEINSGIADHDFVTYTDSIMAFGPKRTQEILEVMSQPRE